MGDAGGMRESRSKNMIQKIEIDFPVPVNLSQDAINLLSCVVSLVCHDNCPAGFAMWPGEQGFEMLSYPLTKEEEDAGKPVIFDESVYHIGVSFRKEDPEGKRLAHERMQRCGLSDIRRFTKKLETTARELKEGKDIGIKPELLGRIERVENELNSLIENMGGG